MVGGVHKTTLYLPDELERELREAARTTGRTQAAVVREALASYLAERRPLMPGFVGSAEGSGLDPATAKDWVRREWAEARRR